LVGNSFPGVLGGYGLSVTGKLRDKIQLENLSACFGINLACRVLFGFRFSV
jgi:hypothetical protein